MDLIYVTDEILNDRSVEGVHVDRICSNLAGLGHSVTLYAPASRLRDGPRGYAQISIPTSRYLYSILLQARLFLRLRRAVAARRPTLLYARHNHLLVAPALISRLYGVPLVLEVNGRLLEEAELIDPSLKGRIARAAGIMRRLDSFITRTAVRLIAVAPAIKEYLERIHSIEGERISVIANGVDTAAFRPMRQPGSAFVTVGYIGSLYPWQGLRYVVQAAKLAASARKHVRFRIIGEGADGGYLEAFVREHDLADSITIAPAIDHRDVPLQINRFDICISYPTLFRRGATSPFKVYEYLACGKAVVLAQIPGMQEEFGDSVAYAKPESPESLAEKIVELADDPDYRAALGKRGREFVENGHSWRDVAQRTALVCEAAIADFEAKDQAAAKDSANARTTSPMNRS